MRKNSLYIFICIINIIVLTATAQIKERDLNAFEISGTVLLNDQRVGDYAVSIYLDGVKIDSMFSKSKRPVYFRLDYNQVYSCLFQKKGCQNKIVIIHTQIPEGLKSIQDHSFYFEIEMSESLKRKSPEIEDLPVAVIMISETDELLKASECYYQLTHQETNVDDTDCQ